MITEKFDIVINGGSFGAVASALSAAREYPEAKILFIEPTDWLGGQATSQGVSAIDNAWQEPYKSLMKEKPEKYYPKDYLEFISELKKEPKIGNGFGGENCCWVSRECFDPRTGAFILEQMLNRHKNISIKKLSVVKRVFLNEEKNIITGIDIIQRVPINNYKPFDKFLSEEFSDWYDEKDSEIFSKKIIKILPNDDLKGMVVIDGSELGDIIVLSGAKYTIGWEMESEEISDDGDLPLMDENVTQSTVFCFCIKTVNKKIEENDLKNNFIDFEEYYNEQKNNYFSFDKYNFGSIWTYRRLKRNGDDKAEKGIVNLGDVSLQNWYPGNDYPYASILKTKNELTEEISDWKGGLRIDQIRNAEKHSIAWYFYLKENQTSNFELKFVKAQDKDNMMDSGTGLSKMPYFRDTRRGVGLNNFRMTEKYFNCNKSTSFRYFDSVGIGQYAIDIHPIFSNNNCVKPSIEKPYPFYIPLRSLASENIKNLLFSGKNWSASSITNAAYRLHPIEWAAGSATGTAASMMLKRNLRNEDLLIKSNLKDLQKIVVKNSPLFWEKYDNNQFPENDGDLIINNFKPFKLNDTISIEVFHPDAYSIKIYFNEKLMESVSNKKNNRFKKDIKIIEYPANFKVECFDLNNKLISEIKEEKCQ